MTEAAKSKGSGGLTEAEDQQAQALVIPEYESKLREAHARADTAAIEDLSGEYTAERRQRFRDSQK